MKFARVLWHIVGGIILVTMLYWNNPSKKEVLLLLGILVAMMGLVDIIRFSSPKGKKWFWRYLGHLADEKEKHGPNTSLFYCISSFMVVWLFQNEVAIAAIISLALGDQISAIVGNYWGRHKWKWKSLEGAVANFAVCTPIMMFFIPYQLAIIGAMAGAIIEALPIKIDDNLTIPLASGGAIYFLNIFAKLI